MPTFMTARWLDVASLSYRIDPKRVRQVLPAGLEPDLHDGAGVVSLVAFSFVDTSCFGVPALGHGRFPEINLRVYARAGDRRGVVFIQEFVPKHAVVTVAQSLFNEPYHWLPMHSGTELMQEDGQTTRHVWHRFGAGSGQLDLWVDPQPATPALSSPERWLTHHETGFGVSHTGQTLEYTVTHPVWACFPLRRWRAAIDFGALYGPAWADLAALEPWKVVVAAGSQVSVSLPRPLQLASSEQASNLFGQEHLAPTGRFRLFYDDDCGFCKASVEELRRRDPDAQVEFLPIQSAQGDAALGDMSEEVRYASIHVVDEQGIRFSGGGALPAVVRKLAGTRLFAQPLSTAPWLTEAGYRFVTRHRYLAGRLIGVSETCSLHTRGVTASH